MVGRKYSSCLRSVFFLQLHFLSTVHRAWSFNYSTHLLRNKVLAIPVFVSFGFIGIQ